MARIKQQLYKSIPGAVKGRKRLRGKAPGNASSALSVKGKKPWRGRLTTKVLQKRRRSQKSTAMLIPQKPFQRLVQTVFHSTEGSLGFQLPACLALQEATEALLVELFEAWRLCALHAKRVGVVSSDAHLVRCLRWQRA